LLAYLAIYAAVQCRQRDWRASLLISATIWGFIVVLINESLSEFQWVGKTGIGIAWLITTVVISSAACWSWRHRGSATTPVNSSRLDREILAVLALLSCQLAVLGIVALTAAPNSDDAMTYHLPRVLHWLENHSVGHYPTSIPRQLYLAPWFSYAVLQFQALLGNDYLACSVQWCSLLVTIVGVSLIARELQAGPAGQALAAVFAGTMPMAVLQSTTAENHLALACWMTCFAWFALLVISRANSKARLYFYISMAGVSLGLAILTKATAYIFAPPMVVWISFALIRRLRWGSLLPLLLFGLLALLPNLPDYVRQAQTFGSPLGPGEEPADLSQPAESYGNLTHSPATIVSNLVRNTALELATPSATLTSGVDRTVRALHRWIGIDINDPRTTWTDGRFILSPERWSNELFAGNPLHFLLIVLACALVLVRFRKWPGLTSVYAASIVCAWILFCGVLRWNPWLARLHLPLLILGAPLVGLVLSEISGSRAALAVAIVCIGLAAPVALMNVNRPLIGPNAYYKRNRLAQYFLQGRPDLEQIDRHLVNLAVTSGPCNAVGLELGRDDEEYLIWMLFHALGLNPRIEHVGVQNASSEYYSVLPPFRPEVVLVLRQFEKEYRIERIATSQP
jgi:hypothetical protein